MALEHSLLHCFKKEKKKCSGHSLYLHVYEEKTNLEGEGSFTAGLPV